MSTQRNNDHRSSDLGSYGDVELSLGLQRKQLVFFRVNDVSTSFLFTMRLYAVSISTYSSQNFVMILRYCYAAICIYCKTTLKSTRVSTLVSYVIYNNSIDLYTGISPKYQHKMTDAGNRRPCTTDQNSSIRKQLHNNLSTQ